MTMTMELGPMARAAEARARRGGHADTAWVLAGIAAMIAALEAEAREAPPYHGPKPAIGAQPDASAPAIGPAPRTRTCEIVHFHGTRRPAQA